MNRNHVLIALDTVTIPGRSFLTDADLLHHEINRLLLELGQDTVGRDELHEVLVDLDYHDALDSQGRVVWQGMGLRVEPLGIVIDGGQVTLRDLPKPKLSRGNQSGELQGPPCVRRAADPTEHPLRTSVA